MLAARIYGVETAKMVSLDLYVSHIRAGFPSPADDYIDRRLDFNEKFIDSPASTFWLRVVGDSMNGAGIMPGAYLLVDRSKISRHRSIVVATVDGDHVVKRLIISDKGNFLCSENPSYYPIPADECIEIFGVCTAAVLDFT